jgi:hypothetical protein
MEANIMNPIRGIIVGALFLSHAIAGSAQAPSPGTRITLSEGWQLNSAAVVKEEGAVISTSRFWPRGWHAVSVPITVLNALTKHRVYPDMRFDLNAFRVPDASDEFNQAQNLAQYSHLADKRNPWADPWWYRTTFQLPGSAAGTHIWLHFDSINYRAEVWLNGNKVADRDQMVSMNQRFTFDISRWAVAGPNCLAVKVWRVDHVGPPGTQLQPLANNRFEDHKSEAPMDYAVQLAGGYDCFPTIPDRYTGILQDVWVEFSGPVGIRDPFVATELPLPRTDSATLKIQASLINTGDKPVSGVLKGSIAEAGLTFETPVTLAAGESKPVRFERAPVMKNPKLWWPNGYGAQYLYDLNLEFVAGGAVSHAQKVRFGVRHITSEMHEYKGHFGRRIQINGQKIFARGGYIQPDALWDWTPERIEAEIRYYAQANLNLIYFEDIANPPDYLFDACDRYGVMIGQCFYGCSWMQSGSKFPADIPLVVKCTRDILKRYRNHPSLVMYMASNEGFTREEVYRPWRASVIELDGSRFWVPSNGMPNVAPDKVEPWFREDMPTGMTDRGGNSYGWEEPSEYYNRVREVPNWMFMVECGSASLPPLSSLQKFIPHLGEVAPGPTFPLDSAWAHHGANKYYQPYDAAVRRVYGEPATVGDYVWQGHLATADQHRAMFEAVNHRLWDITSGFTQWKINSAWPDVQWQIFDWFLKPMVSYYFIKRANEPVHIQLGLIEPMVTVVNHSLEPRSGLKVRARVLDPAMRVLFEKQENADVAANSYCDVFELPKLPDLPSVYFVRLDLSDAGGGRLSDNTYWLPAEKGAPMKALRSLPLVPVSLRQSVEEQGGRLLIHATVENASDQLAFFVQLAATREDNGEEILPVYWSDNYISLLPKERRSLTAEVAKTTLRGARPVVEAGGWNVQTAYRCTSLSVPDSVDSGAPVKVNASITSTFLDGSRVDLVVDGQTKASQYHFARAGKSAAAKFEVQLPAGVHTIAVGQRTARVTVP